MKLSIKEKLGYSLGDTASHFVWDLVGFWLLIFYTDIYGLSPALAGVIMFVGSIWDAIMDLPEPYSQALIIGCLSGYDSDAAATILGINTNQSQQFL